MSSIYDFVEEKMELMPSVLDKALRYETLKNRLGFEWWSIKKEGNELIISFDDSTVELEVNGKLGHITRSERVDDLCVQICGKREDTITLALADFKKSVSCISERLNSNTTHQFCSSLNTLLVNDAEDEDVLNESEISDGNTLNSSSLTEVEDEGHTSEGFVDEDKEMLEVSKNLLMQEAAAKRVGTFDIPLKALELSTAERALRVLDPRHIAELRRDLETEFDNGHEICLPPAVGLISNDMEMENVPEMLKAGELQVCVIDGNHTCHVLKELSEKYPEAEGFKKRKVVVYKGLDESMISMLALLGNEESSNSLKTSDYHKVKVMRKHLSSRFGGRFCHKFQQSMYMIFNVLCPSNSAEEARRKRNIQHLLRMSTMDQQTWEGIERLMQGRPSIKMSAFRDLGRLTTTQSVELIGRLERREIKLAQLKDIAKTMTVPEDAEKLVFQRIRKRKQRQSKDTTDEKTKEKDTVLNNNRTDNSNNLAVPAEDIIKLKEQLKATEKDRDSLKQKLEQEEMLRTENFKLKKERAALLETVQTSTGLESRLKGLTRERDLLYLKLKEAKSIMKQKGEEVECLNRTNNKLRDKIKLMQTEMEASEAALEDMKRENDSKLPFSQIGISPKIYADAIRPGDKDPNLAKRKKGNECEEQTEFRVGDRVWALWGDKKYPHKYPAVIIRKTDSSYEVKFEEDDCLKSYTRPVKKSQLCLLTPESLKGAL